MYYHAITCIALVNTKQYFSIKTRVTIIILRADKMFSIPKRCQTRVSCLRTEKHARVRLG